MTGRLAPFPRFTGAEPCQDPDYDPDLWSSSDPVDRATAQLACLSGCPVREKCLAWAIDHPTEAGDDIWAGTTKARRTTLRREFSTTATRRKSA
ncbi:WhiB family transcriptional regulator [Streptomyces actinomycinicus]|uniref:WhiB family transcriptional regulator n=1 Tax=Streptomyces actinomycinicus TaxID=1695166 RepID=A0A937EQP1_9ACTN|nr:WhiB family transcriptional regulator [Streptomyces actinomycinicus]MBL1086813.1 WhiB family transcriptional regulator [Streptomyces actinomycinicus]